MEESRFSILIVDDNKANLRILEAVFEDEGFKVFCAGHVPEAQAQISEHASVLDLVLSDVQMPGLSGFDLVKWIKDSKLSAVSEIPVLLITSQAPDPESRIRGLSLGAVDYCVRSLDSKELVLRTRHAIENYTQLKKLRQSIEKSENIVATGRLFAASNHEIKNIAQIVGMASGILINSVSEEARRTGILFEATRMLQQSSQLLSEITRNIGALVGDSPATVSPIDLRRLFSDVLTLVRPLLKKEIDAEVVCEENPRISGNVTFLKQIFINIFLNAKDAIEELKPTSRGKIVIKAFRMSEERVAIEIIDNGIGFPEAMSKTEFKPFASTKQLRGGTGLGLWLSAHLLQKMGGELSLSSKGFGQGVTARMTLRLDRT